MRLNHEKELLQMKQIHWEELKRSSEEILQMKIHQDKAVAKAKEVNEEELKNIKMKCPQRWLIMKRIKEDS